MKWSSFFIGAAAVVVVYKFGAGIPGVSTVRNLIA